MSRTLNAKVTAAVADTITRPVYLVQLDFSITLRYSTGGAISWNGHTWSEADVAVSGIRELKGGTYEAILEFGNAENEISSIVLSEGVRDKAVNIWQLYGDAPYAADDAVHLFTGVIDSVPQIGYPTQLRAVSRGAGAIRSPRVPLAVILGEDMAAPGERITWGGQTYVLEAQSG